MITLWSLSEYVDLLPFSATVSGGRENIWLRHRCQQNSDIQQSHRPRRWCSLLFWEIDIYQTQTRIRVVIPDFSLSSSVWIWYSKARIEIELELENSNSNSSVRQRAQSSINPQPRVRVELNSCRVRPVWVSNMSTEGHMEYRRHVHAVSSTDDEWLWELEIYLINRSLVVWPARVF